jgi:regulator of nucleoside diphosphate kinase
MGGNHADVFVDRPPIVLTKMDRSRLSILLNTPLGSESDVAWFLREEINRAIVVCGEVTSTAVVRMGSEVRFIDHASTRARQVRLVYPDEADDIHLVSVLSPLGGALIGLGPGQSIGWIEQGVERRLSVLEIFQSLNQASFII